MGKGGVGKSLVSTLLAENLINSGATVFCADTDPTNPTFSSYPAFGAKHIDIMTPDMNIDRSRFDDLIDLLLTHEGECVLDNGASSFLPMMSYLIQYKVIEFLRESGHDVVVHAVLIGGLGMDETLRMLEVILESQPAPVVVWENELFGPIIKGGKTFGESDLYKMYAERICGIVKIPSHSEDTFGKDMHNLTSNRLTIAEAMNSPSFKTMSRQRLKQFERRIGEQLAATGVA